MTTAKFGGGIGSILLPKTGRGAGPMGVCPPKGPDGCFWKLHIWNQCEKLKNWTKAYSHGRTLKLIEPQRRCEVTVRMDGGAICISAQVRGSEISLNYYSTGMHLMYQCSVCVSKMISLGSPSQKSWLINKTYFEYITAQISNFFQETTCFHSWFNTAYTVKKIGRGLEQVKTNLMFFGLSLSFYMRF